MIMRHFHNSSPGRLFVHCLFLVVQQLFVIPIGQVELIYNIFIDP